MARPRKCRRVCCIPERKIYGPIGSPMEENNVVLMSVEEYEVVRLIDLVGLTQEESAARMDVARPSIQRLYVDARKKLAESLVNGKMIKIEGGDYFECTGDNIDCCDPKCAKRCR